MARRCVLVTGGSGVVGRAVAAELPDHHVIALTHSDNDVPEADEAIRCDLRMSRMGLAPATWHDLAERVDVVVHSGALTEWGLAPERYRAVNIDGTVHVLDLARAAGAAVHLVSSAFVHALERVGADGLTPGNLVTAYIASKLESERLVAGSGLPYSIHRPTNIVGDSTTGACSRPQIVIQLSDWLARGRTPYFPLHPGNLMDFVPLDVSARAIARGVQRAELDGRTFWHTNGPEAMTAEQALEIVREHAAEQGRRIDPIPVVDATAPLPVPLDRMPPISRRYLRVLIDTSEVTAASGGVLPTSPTDLRERLGVPAVDDREAYRLSLRYWAAERRVEETRPA